MIIAKAEPTNFEPAPTGTIQAVCAFVSDIGFQEGEYQGEKNVMHKVIVSWELSEKMKDGRPFMMSKYYTLSLGDKANLKKDLESWRGKVFTEEERAGFDIEKLIGANCLLTVIAHKADKDKRVIAGIAALPRTMPKIAISQTEPSEKYKAWIDRERAKSVEMQPATEPHTVDTEGHPAENDGLPF
jgi:hypothetical protein